MNAVELRGVSFGYADRLLLESFDLQVGEGEFFGVIGPNGAGKTTLLKLVAGLLKPAAGSVMVLGKDLRSTDRAAVARELGVVLQESQFAFEYSVEDVVMMGRNPHLGRFEQPRGRDREAVVRALEFCDVKGLRGTSINSISSGERQRVVLARALAQEPQILLLDEATSHLDIAHQLQTGRILAELNRQGRTVIMLSHDLNFAALYCSRILLLDNGRARACDVPERVITRDLISSTYGVEPLLTIHPQSGRPQVMLPGA